MKATLSFVLIILLSGCLLSPGDAEIRYEAWSVGESQIYYFYVDGSGFGTKRVSTNSLDFTWTGSVDEIAIRIVGTNFIRLGVYADGETVYVAKQMGGELKTW